MKKQFLSVLTLLFSLGVQADELSNDFPNDNIDSLRIEQLNEVVVRGVKAEKNAPFAVANIDRRQLDEFSKSAQELPFLFAQTPGVLAWSENGLGTGTAYMRIRGAGGSRINVTIDGVQLNSPEDQCVFWANMNSYAALLGGAQIQRGVGTSTNGDGAFGGSIALTTKAPQLRPGGELSVSYGSYNTANVGANLSTGLLLNHLVIDGAWHHTRTDGYVHGTGGKSGSYAGRLAWLADNFQLSYKNIGNYEMTGQAWNGVIAGDYDGNVLWDENGLPSIASADYKQLYDRGYGQWNSLVERIDYDWQDGLTATPYTLRDGSRWKQTTDNYWQNHNILSLAWNINPHLTTSATLHYSYDYGFYREFKYQNKLSKYGLPNFTLANGDKLKKSDFIRKKGMEEDTYGAIWNLNYKDEHWNIIGGLNYQHFSGNHFGFLTYMGNEELEAYYLNTGAMKYYDSDARKTDFNSFLKTTLSLGQHLDIFADLQFRHVDYKTDGYNDKFYTDSSGEIQKHLLNIDEHYNFFNPKAGLTYKYGPHKTYASVAIAHREPERNNFTDNGHYPAPRAERLTDFEVGYEFTSERFRVGANLYYMYYKDQFVQTGQMSDIGEALTTNIARSYRLGAEITAGWNALEWLNIDGNLALSENKIKDFDEIVAGYDKDWNDALFTFHHDNTTLAYSPSLIANIFITAHRGPLRATWQTQGVSRQYLDNSESLERSLPGYCVSNLSASYIFRLGGQRELQLSASLNNVFNRHFAQSGFVWYQYITTEGQRLSHNSYIPSAGRTLMTNLTFRF